MNKLKYIFLIAMSKQLFAIHPKLCGIIYERYIKIPRYNMCPYYISTIKGPNLIIYQDEEHNNYIPSKKTQELLLPYYIKCLSENSLLKLENKKTYYMKCSRLIYDDQLTYSLKHIRKLDLLYLEHEDGVNQTISILKEEELEECENTLLESNLRKLDYNSKPLDPELIDYKNIKVNINQRFFA